MKETVCAVVVTYNRKALLDECLRALHAQSHPVHQIFLIDNASTDGTAAMLEERGYLADPKLRYLRLDRNVGGAGGFHHGFREAYDAGFDWIWAMDDDTIVDARALEHLFGARESFGGSGAPDLLSSQVVWIDGSPHPMNRPWLKAEGRHPVPPSADAPVSIRATTFVALLLHRRCIEAFGLPLADYFIWSDDIEFTARILRTQPGVLVPQSIAVHKTPQKHGPLGANPDRFYFHVRNTLWMLTRSRAWSWAEAMPQFWSLLLVMQATLRRAPRRSATLRAIITGLRDGVFRRPGR